MSGFLITNHYPAINETDVPRNPVIKVYFNRELNISSITYRSISIHDSLYATVPGDVEYDYSDGGTSSGVANILTFTPSIQNRKDFLPLLPLSNQFKERKKELILLKKKRFCLNYARSSSSCRSLSAICNCFTKSSISPSRTLSSLYSVRFIR